MSLDFSTIWPLIQAAGLPGLAVAVIVLIFVFIGSYTELFKNGNIRRVAVALLGILFSGVVTNPDTQQALVAAIGVVGATLLKLLLDMLFNLAKQQKAAVTAKPK